MRRKEYCELRKRRRQAANALFFPVERALFNRVNVSDRENSDEAQHAPEDERPARVDEIPIHDCPRIHEDNLDIEKDKEHCYEVELHAEARLRWAFRKHAAFIG